MPKAYKSVKRTILFDKKPPNLSEISDPRFSDRLRQRLQRCPCEEDHLQQHARVIRRTAKGLVRTHKICDVKSVNDAAQKANMMRFWNYFTQKRRKKLSW